MKYWGFRMGKGGQQGSKGWGWGTVWAVSFLYLDNLLFLLCGSESSFCFVCPSSLFYQPEYSLEVLTLKLQYFGTWCKEQTQWKRPWCWERLRAGEGGNRWWDGWMASSTQQTWVRANSGKTVKEREAWHAVVHRVTNSQTRLSNGPVLFYGGNSLSLWSEEIMGTFSSSRTNSPTS